jgi:sec-independent protein translocase protein TatB
MFDVGASELLMIVIVAVVVIGPKDMPMALRTAGRWIGKMRKISGHFRSGIDTMVREAELEEMERKWREQNEAIMRANPQLPVSGPGGDEMAPLPTSAEAALASIEPGSPREYAQTEEEERVSEEQRTEEEQRSAQPQLPLPPP